MVAKELRITGRVHDVGYRLFLLSEAEELLLERFSARNIVTEGKECVLVRVAGPEELVSRFVAFAESQYPPEAVVDSVEVRAYSGTVVGIDSFRQSLMVTQLAKLTQAGVSMVGKQDRTIEILESVKGDTAMMLEKQDETIAVIKEEGEKTREVVQEEGEKTRGVLKGTLAEDMVWVKDEIIDMKATLNRVKQKVGVE